MGYCRGGENKMDISQCVSDDIVSFFKLVSKQMYDMYLNKTLLKKDKNLE